MPALILLLKDITVYFHTLALTITPYIILTHLQAESHWLTQISNSPEVGSSSDLTTLDPEQLGWHDGNEEEWKVFYNYIYIYICSLGKKL